MPSNDFFELTILICSLLWQFIKALVGAGWKFFCSISPGTYTIAISVIGLCMAARRMEDIWEESCTKSRLKEEVEEAFFGRDPELQVETKDTNCRICGEEFGASLPLVVCRQCGTIHHEDCWKYTGQCSIYGCGATRSMKEVPK